MNPKSNPASEAISMVKAAQTNEEDIPVTPLPNPGEGGPVYDGSASNGSMDTIPAITVLLMKISVLFLSFLCQIPAKADLYTAGLIITGLSAAWDNTETLRYLYTVLFSLPTALSPFSQASVSHVITVPLLQDWAAYVF